jgi:hypothetical protein
MSNEKQGGERYDRSKRQLSKSLQNWFEEGRAINLCERQMADDLENLLKERGVKWRIVFAF